MANTHTVTLKMRLPRVSLIIAAYNEQAHIGDTLRAILESGFPCELIVVNDGSSDATPAILEAYADRAMVISHSRNRGKGSAIASGLRRASGDIVVFCDAHLQGLTCDHLLALVMPLLQGNVHEVLGLDMKAGASLLRTFSPGFILTGQRAYLREDLMPLVDDIEDLGYGLETFLFAHFTRKSRAIVLLPGLMHLLKADTSAFSAAFFAYLREAAEIAEAMGVVKGIIPIAMVRGRKRVANQLVLLAGRKAVSR